MAAIVVDLVAPTGNKITLLTQQICQIAAITSDTSTQAIITLLDGAEYVVAANASDIIASLVSLGGGSNPFVEATLPDGGNCWMLLSAVTAVIPANEALNNPGASGNTRVFGVGWGYVDVTDSLATIFTALSIQQSSPGVALGLPMPPTDLVFGSGSYQGGSGILLTFTLPTTDVYGNALPAVGLSYEATCSAGGQWLSGGGLPGAVGKVGFFAPVGNPVVDGTYTVVISNNAGPSAPSSSIAYPP